MKLVPDQTKNFHSVDAALEDLGFERKGTYSGPPNAVGKVKTYEIFEKDGKCYKFDSWDHYNTVIYSITLKPVDINNLQFEQ